MGRFVLDFYCPSIKLVVEVEGDIQDSQPEQDAARTTVVETYGYRAMRFRNDEVMHDLPGVVSRIAAVVEASA